MQCSRNIKDPTGRVAVGLDVGRGSPLLSAMQFTKCCSSLKRSGMARNATILRADVEPCSSKRSTRACVASLEDCELWFLSGWTSIIKAFRVSDTPPKPQRRPILARGGRSLEFMSWIAASRTAAAKASDDGGTSTLGVGNIGGMPTSCSTLGGPDKLEAYPCNKFRTRFGVCQAVMLIPTCKKIICSPLTCLCTRPLRVPFSPPLHSHAARQP